MNPEYTPKIIPTSNSMAINPYSGHWDEKKKSKMYQGQSYFQNPKLIQQVFV